MGLRGRGSSTWVAATCLVLLAAAPVGHAAPEPFVRDSLYGNLNGMNFAPDGTLYGPIWTTEQIVRIDVDADPPTVEPVADLVAAAVTFDSQGRMHAAERQHGDVVRVDPASGGTEVLATLEQGLDNLAFDASDRLFVPAG